MNQPLSDKHSRQDIPCLFGILRYIEPDNGWYIIQGDRQRKLDSFEESIIEGALASVSHVAAPSGGQPSTRTDSQESPAGEHLAAAAPSSTQPTDSVCWLLERGQAVGHAPTMWFKGDSLHNEWTEDAAEARRFASKVEAEQEADRLFGRFTGDGLRRCTATEHVFVMRDDRWIGGALRQVHAAPSAIESPSWQPIETAPKTGPVETILLYVPQLNGTGGPVLAHWAHGGGEEQPAFGPAWFYSTGYGFHELPRGHKPTHWMSLPRCPADWRAARCADGTANGEKQ